MKKSYQLGTASLRNLSGVHPELVSAVQLAIELTEQDFCILAGGGLRTPTEAQANAAAGTGIVNSMHLPQEDGFSHAVDLVAYVAGKPSWDRKYYPPIRKAMLEACDRLGVLIQHGADWDLDGVLEEPGEWDWPHFQFPKLPKRREAARMAAQQRLTAWMGRDDE